MVRILDADRITFSHKDCVRIYNAWKSCADYAQLLHQMHPKFPYLKYYGHGIPGTPFYKIVSMWYFGDLLLALQHNSVREADEAYAKYRRIVDAIYYCDGPGKYIINGWLLPMRCSGE